VIAPLSGTLGVLTMPRRSVTVPPAAWALVPEGHWSDGARVFTAASSHVLTSGSNSSVVMGNFDFWVAAWVRCTTSNTTAGIAGKWDSTANKREWRLLRVDTGLYRWDLSSNGQSGTQTSLSGPASRLNEWDFVLAWYDAAADQMRIRVNHGDTLSAAHASGAFVSDSPFMVGRAVLTTAYFDGSIDELLVAKQPVGGIAGVIDGISEALYNGGAGLPWSQISSADRTAWGLTASYAMDGTGTTEENRLGFPAIGSTTNAPAPGAGHVPIEAADGGPVALWGHASQPTYANRPTYRAVGVGTEPAVESDGTSSRLALADVPALAGPFTIYLIGRRAPNAVHAPLGTAAGSAGAITWGAANVLTVRTTVGGSATGGLMGEDGDYVLRVRRRADDRIFAARVDGDDPEIDLGTLAGSITFDQALRDGGTQTASGGRLAAVQIYDADLVGG
jgi:hypothetical protein